MGRTGPAVKHICEPCRVRDRPNPGVLLCAYCDHWFCYAHLADKSHDCFAKLYSPKTTLKG